jgi:hypothetical protein
MQAVLQFTLHVSSANRFGTHEGAAPPVSWIKHPALAGCLLEFTARTAPGSGPGCKSNLPRGLAGARKLE